MDRKTLEALSLALCSVFPSRSKSGSCSQTPNFKFQVVLYVREMLPYELLPEHILEGRPVALKLKQLISVVLQLRVLVHSVPPYGWVPEVYRNGILSTPFNRSA